MKIEEDGSVTQVTEKEASRVKKSLQELRKWLVTDDDRQTKNRQKLLRNLRVCAFMALILILISPLEKL